MWALRHKDRHYTLSKSSVSIGQGTECDVIIQSSSVDSQHAVLHYVPDVDQYIIRDLGSATGTYVNDQKVQGDQGVWLQSCDQVKCGRDAPVLTVERLYMEDENHSPSVSPKVNHSLQVLAAPPTSSSTQTSPEKYPFCISPNMPVLPLAYCVPLNADHLTASHDVKFPLARSLPPDVHIQPATVMSAWSMNNDGINNGSNAPHAEANQTMTPSSDVIDSSYYRQDGRRNLSCKRGSSLYGQPSWWTPPEEDAPLTLQPIHSATKWTEASPTPVKSDRISSAPPDPSRRRSTSIKTTAVVPRERTGSVKESKLTTRLIRKFTPSTKKVSSSGEVSTPSKKAPTAAEDKISTSSSSSTPSSASNSNSDLQKNSVSRGTPKRQTYIKRTSNIRPRSAEVASSSSSTTSLQKPVQKSVAKFDRRSPQRHTYNKKEPALANKTAEEVSPTQKPRETVAELRQRMQAAKKAAATTNKVETDVQIFVSSSSSKAAPNHVSASDHVIDDSNMVSSSGMLLSDSDTSQGSHRKHWEINEAVYSMDHLTLASLQALSLHLSQLADAACVKVKDFAESSLGRVVMPLEATTTSFSTLDTSQNVIPEWLGSHKEMKGVYRNLRSVEHKLIEVSQVIDQHNPQFLSSTETSSSS